MNKPPLGLLISVLVLVAAALIVWVGQVLKDGDVLEQGLRRLVEERTGGELAIAGSSRLVLWPPLGIAVDDIRFDEAPDHDGPPLARIGAAELRLSPWPLLLGRLEIASVHLDDVRLQLARARSATIGHVLPPAVDNAEVKAPLGEAKSAVSVAAADEGTPLHLGAFRIRNLTVSWQDRETVEVHELGGIDLSTDSLVLGEPTGWHLAMPLSDVGPITAGRLRGDGELTLGRDGIAIGPSPVRLRLDDLVAANDRRGSLELTATVSGDRAVGYYALDALEVAAHLESGNGGAALDVRLTAWAALDRPEGRLTFSDVAFDADGLRLSGALAVAGLSESPTLIGHLALDRFDLRDWLVRHGLPRPPAGPKPGGWRQLGGEADVAGDSDGLTLAPLALSLDDTRLDGELRLLFERPLGVRFDLATDRLELAASGHAEPAPDPAAAGGPKGDATERPAPSPESTSTEAARTELGEPASRLGVLRKLDLDGRLEVGRLRVRGLEIAPAHLTMKAEDGVLRLGQQGEAGGFYGGRLDGHLDVDVRGERPRSHLVAQAKGIDIGPLLEDLRGEARLEGRGDLDLDLTAVGTTGEDLRASLNGRIGLAIRDGLVPGVDLEGLIESARASLRGGAPEGRGEGTRFSSLTATAEARDGVLHNNDLAGRSDYFTLTGYGTVDLVHRQLDYELRPVLVDPPRGHGLKELEGVPIPVEVSGPLGEPSWSVDLGPVLQELARRRLERRGGRLLEDLEERLGGDGLEGLRGLLGR
ncbi:uncharacterized protein involved in outer membrane biogenesis [Thioflavicoccus mobilis 8321]|uniref:Uncharacterized protein involved in outer membrane biogenesis n=1 Tax=Thioflavicoccus mobilis 8321 TaxID=765912 RepID=L0GZP4_9GAMM|nr:AsmA family protein [Thioflavicoccus mobilis]AGA90794.1 uncharacterized protein involved in outer membrane biogenesis [Thioflavicoccus mobilis 8321]